MMHVFAVLATCLALVGAAAAQDLPDEIAEPYVAYSQAMEARDYPAAMASAQQAWRAAETLEFDAETTGTLAENYAQLAAALGDHSAALEACRSAARLRDEAGLDDGLVAETWILAARSALEAGEERNAMRWADTGGDLAERAVGLDPTQRARLMFSSRAIHASALWRAGRVAGAAMRAQEAFDLAEGYDLTDTQSFATMTFVLGAHHAMEREFENAAFRLTQAYVYTPELRDALGP
jgi:tetratricopeptide (TPR) repeat protein